MTGGTRRTPGDTKLISPKFNQWLTFLHDARSMDGSSTSLDKELLMPYISSVKIASHFTLKKPIALLINKIDKDSIRNYSRNHSAWIPCFAL